MKVISGICAGIILWVAMSFWEINMQNKAPNPEYAPDNAFVLLSEVTE